MNENVKCIKHISLKGNNKRIKIGLFLNIKDNNHFFIQSTRTLVDRKKRQIISTQNIYSVETFAVLNDVFSKFLNDSEIANKILNIELSKVVRFSGTSNF
jgi:hypothetical protein